MPAAAVIPVPIVYASIAAVKTLVVERYNMASTTAVFSVFEMLCFKASRPKSSFAITFRNCG